MLNWEILGRKKISDNITKYTNWIRDQNNSRLLYLIPKQAQLCNYWLRGVNLIFKGQNTNFRMKQALSFSSVLASVSKWFNLSTSSVAHLWIQPAVLAMHRRWNRLGILCVKHPDGAWPIKNNKWSSYPFITGCIVINSDDKQYRLLFQNFHRSQGCFCTHQHW